MDRLTGYKPPDREQELTRLVWIKGPASPASSASLASLASMRLQRALLGSVTRCHRSASPPKGGAPAAVVVCCPDGGPEGVASAVGLARELSPQASVVVLGPSPDPELARAAVRAGARGFLHSGMPPEQVARALSVALSGEVVLPRELLKELVAVERPADLSALRERQREILALVAEGLSNAEIASKLYLSESTVKQHLRRAYKTLGVKNRIEAAAALRRGSNRSPSASGGANPRPGI